MAGDSVAEAITHKTDKEAVIESVGLRPKEKSFALYVGGGDNVVDAYLAAGYTAPYAQLLKLASDLMRKKRVQELVRQTREANVRRWSASAAATIKENAILAGSSFDDYEQDLITGRVRVKPGVPKEAIRAIKSVRFKQIVNARTGEIENNMEIVMHDKGKAIALNYNMNGLVGDAMPDIQKLINRLPPEMGVKLTNILAVTDGDAAIADDLDGDLVDEALVDPPAEES